MKTFTPARLSLARRRRGISTTELGRRVEVVARTVRGWELGEFPPTTENINRLASELNFPREFFFGAELEEVHPEGASFRSLSTMTVTQRDAALAAGSIAIEIARVIEDSFVLPEPDVPDLRQFAGRPEDAARALREQWQLGERPIKNLVHLLEAHGCWVMSLAEDYADVDGFSCWRRDRPFIFLNTRKSAERGRFDAAHELGHLVLHRHGGNQLGARETEREADAFASAFLMPRAAIVATAPRLPSLPSLLAMKQTWGVSLASMVRRLNDVRMMSDSLYRQMCIQISARGWRKSEPHEGTRETSQTLTKVFAALREDGVGRAAFASKLALMPADVDALVFGLAMTALDGGGAGGPPRGSLSLVR